MVSRRACELCGIGAGNAAGIEIRSYVMVRSVRKPDGTKTSRSFGVVLACDRCQRERERGATMTPERAVAV